jgi:DNA-binding LytR/AlgR family response regulator
MTELRYLIIEDEKPAAERLHNMLTTLLPHSQLQAVLPSVEESIKWLKARPLAFDLLFVDVELADGLSFDIFESCPVHQPVIFTTAYDQYALQAFQVNSIDYLLKPIKLEKLQQALDKLQLRHPSAAIDYQQLAEAIRKQEHTYQERILVRTGDSLQALPLQEAAYFYTQDKVVFMRMRNGRTYPIDPHLDQLENMLNPHKFFRINRQYIINLQAIEQMCAWSKSRIKLMLQPLPPTETVVSSYRTAEFKEWLEQA